MTVLPTLVYTPAAGRTSHRTGICLHTKLHCPNHTSSRPLSSWIATDALILGQMLSLARKENIALVVYPY